jgi:hypothetical protein
MVLLTIILPQKRSSIKYTHCGDNCRSLSDLLRIDVGKNRERKPSDSKAEL